MRVRVLRVMEFSFFGGKKRKKKKITLTLHCFFFFQSSSDQVKQFGPSFVLTLYTAARFHHTAGNNLFNLFFLTFLKEKKLSRTTTTIKKCAF